jgi:hypothetical protein
LFYWLPGFPNKTCVDKFFLPHRPGFKKFEGKIYLPKFVVQEFGRTGKTTVVVSQHEQAGYHIQGWKRNKIYPDFIATMVSSESSDDYNAVYVLETKGIHLKNEDTRYKQDVFALCNELGAKRAWKELFDEFPNGKRFLTKFVCK